jgi:hypothetical protein
VTQLVPGRTNAIESLDGQGITHQYLPKYSD